MKHCKKCNTEKKLSDFYLDKRRNKLQTPCKDCRIKANDHSWRKSNPTKNRESDRRSKLRSKYELSLEMLTDLWLSQDKACAICKHPISLAAIEKSSKPHIDHCHVSGVVRGLLCLTCNTGLGMFGDSSDLLDAASDYLLSRGATALPKPIPDTASVSAECNNTIH